MKNPFNRAVMALGGVGVTFRSVYTGFLRGFRYLVYAVGFLSLCHLFVGGSSKRLYVVLGGLIFVGIGMIVARKRSRKL